MCVDKLGHRSQNTITSFTNINICSLQIDYLFDIGKGAVKVIASKYCEVQP